VLRGSLPPASLDMAQDALAAARQLEDPELIARALIACGMLAFYSAEVAQRFFDEAIAGPLPNPQASGIRRDDGG
jgi:hypothetical protein